MSALRNHPDKALLVVLSLLFSIASIRAQESAATDEVIGSVGTYEVKISDLRKSLETLSQAEREALRLDSAALGQYVRALLVQRLVLSEAMEAKWDKSAVVAERMAALREGVVANTYLESVSAPPEGFPGEEELKGAYQANRESFLEPKSWNLAQIFVASPKEKENPEAAAKLKRLSDSLKKDATSFPGLAATESEEPNSAAKGGEIGWLPESRIHPDIRAILPGMKLGDVSAPVRMDDGWHLVKVLDIREARIPTLEQIRIPLTEQLRAERTSTGTERFLGDLLRENPIAINEMVLSKLLPGTD